MQPRPLIAVTSTLAPGGAHGLPQVMLGAAYIAAVEAAGGSAVLLTPAHDPASVVRLLDASHGLLLTGGEDVDPTRYGQEPHPLCEAPTRRAMQWNSPRWLAHSSAGYRCSPSVAGCSC